MGATLIELALGLPLVGAVLIAVTGRYPNLREGVTLGTAVALFAVIAIMLGLVLDGARPQWGPWTVFGTVTIGFAVEPLGMLFATVASGLWIVNSVYSIGYMRGNKEPRQTPFYVCFAIAIFGAMGAAMAEGLLTLFLFYEILTLSTYPLVTHKANAEARGAGRVYLLLLLGTSMMLLLPAIVWTAAVAGTVSFAPGGILAGAGLSTTALGILFALYLFGTGKAAVMPVHVWLPAAMVAPTPVSALLHAVAVVKAGVFTVVKVVVYVFGIDLLAETGASAWAVYVAGFTVLAASVLALMADNLKRRLAYSTVSQLSYVVMAAAVASPAAVMGAMLHIVAHAVSKITLFFAAGSIYTAAHLSEISQLDGIGRRMPYTMAAFGIGALAMIGVPPTATVLSKWFMLQGDYASGNWFAISVVLISTAMNVAYFLPILYRAFWLAPPKPDAAHPEHGEAPWAIVLSLSFTAALTVGLFLYPAIPYELASQMVADQVPQASEVTP